MLIAETGIVLFTGLPQKLQNQIPGLSRTILGHFQGLFKFFLQVFKFNFDNYSFMHLFFVLVIGKKF